MLNVKHILAGKGANAEMSHLFFKGVKWLHFINVNAANLKLQLHQEFWVTS